MANVIGNIFRVKDLRRKILFTMFILIVYRIGAHVPIPGVNVEALEKFFDEASRSSAGGLLNFFDLFAGGALKRFTVFALGIMPYISASIIIQLMAVVVPALGTLTKEGGPEGRKKINSYTKYLTIFLCIFQSTGISMMLINNNVVTEGYGVMFYVINAIAITTGTLVLMWLGEMITERGIGNGISLIIFAGIIVRFPAAMIDTGSRIVNRSEPIMAIVLGLVFLIVIAASIMLLLGRRNIPIQYGKRQMGDRQVSAGGQTLPLPLNAGNVIRSFLCLRSCNCRRRFRICSVFRTARFWRVYNSGFLPDRCPILSCIAR
jgi:preprotein translocase subunit SecY